MTKIKLWSWRQWYIEYRFYILPAVVMTVVAGLTVLVVIPQVKQNLELTRLVKEESGKLGRMKQKTGLLRQAQGSDLATRVGVVEKALPSEKEVGDVLVGLRRAAEKAGVALLSIELSPGELGGTETKVAQQAEKGNLPMTVSLVGSRSGFQDFLAEIQTMVPIARVTEFSINEEGGGIQVKLKLDGQYWPAPTTLAAADKELASLTNDEEKLYQRLRAVVAAMTETESASAAAEVPVGNVDLIR